MNRLSREEASQNSEKRQGPAHHIQTESPSTYIPSQCGSTRIGRQKIFVFTIPKLEGDCRKRDTNSGAGPFKDCGPSLVCYHLYNRAGLTYGIFPFKKWSFTPYILSPNLNCFLFFFFFFFVYKKFVWKLKLVLVLLDSHFPKNKFTNEF